jgi:hypothetical protein
MDLGTPPQRGGEIIDSLMKNELQTKQEIR